MIKPILAALCIAWTSAHPVWAANETWPTKPVRIVLPGPPGSSPDRFTRIIAERLSKMWGQPVVVDNRPGGATRIGTEHVARSAPDGYTLLSTFGSHSMTKLLHADTSFDPVKDFAPITPYAAPEVVFSVAASSPYKTLAELSAALKAARKPLGYAHFGNGSPFHLWGLMVGRTYGVEVLPVAYKGEALQMTDLLGGHVDSSFNSVGTALPHMRAGKVRALGLIAPARSKVVPEVPTFAELGVAGLESGGWFGFLAPAHTPPSVVDKLAADIQSIVQDPQLAKEMREQGIEPFTSSPAEFARQIGRDTEMWRRLLNDFNVKLD